MRSFGELEARVMTSLWEADRPATVHEVVADLGERKAVAYTTVITVLERLRNKGWVSRSREGRSYRYATTATEHEYSAHLMSQVLEEAPDRSAALLSFAGQLEASELRALLDALGVESEGDGGSRE
ncbi:BlaI/MecI/CopY family transcriptional regulator [Nocardioides aurantiacus]|uniref:Putative transcriptional regulator n=1 Tax=Nocardioides aurantiacus TaxID=86796 RepID=A0A3N2CWC1_9ACTN|nr:BlaI/MecI/CopY family transcriptional regulator [Nocardioides aurantiacus]ROR91847.1 putative transcriptional regulator [Nocardioides aurantiacus]